jgi:hypothetical protein
MASGKDKTMKTTDFPKMQKLVVTKPKRKSAARKKSNKKK